MGPELADDKAVDRTHEQAGGDAAQDAQDEIVLQQLHRHHAGKGDGHGQAHVVEVGRIDDECQTHGADAGERNGLQNTVDIAECKELIRSDALARDQQQGHHHIDAQAVDDHHEFVHFLGSGILPHRGVG